MKLKHWGINLMLLGGLAALLLAFALIVGDLPSQIYTTEQQSYLADNRMRSVSQQPVLVNALEYDMPLGFITPDALFYSSATADIALPVARSEVRATLQARYEEREGVSVTVYDLRFAGEYLIRYTDAVTRAVSLFFPFPNNLETLHNVSLQVDGEETPNTRYNTRGIEWRGVLAEGDERSITIRYQADGANSFSYALSREQRTDIDIRIIVEGLTGSTIAKTSLPATQTDTEAARETFIWDYTNLIANRDIGLTLPTRLSFTQRVEALRWAFLTLSGLAPLWVLLFMAALGGLLHLTQQPVDMRALLLAGFGLALFYPLLIFLSGLVGLIPAAALAAVIITALLVGFIGLLLGLHRTWKTMGLLLVVFIGCFSLGMLTPWRGIALTLGGLLLTGAFMVHYARRPHPAPVAALPQETPPPPQREELPQEDPPATTHCPRCGRALNQDHAFCPGCGYEMQHYSICPACSYAQLTPADVEKARCLRCGKRLA